MFDEMLNNICIDIIKVLLTLKLGDGAGFKTRNDDPDHAECGNVTLVRTGIFSLNTI